MVTTPQSTRQRHELTGPIRAPAPRGSPASPPRAPRGEAGSNASPPRGEADARERRKRPWISTVVAAWHKGRRAETALARACLRRRAAGCAAVAWLRPTPLAPLASGAGAAVPRPPPIAASNQPRRTTGRCCLRVACRFTRRARASSGTRSARASNRGEGSGRALADARAPASVTMTSETAAARARCPCTRASVTPRNRWAACAPFSRLSPPSLPPSNRRRTRGPDRSRRPPLFVRWRAG